jgi:hypothetical protein
MCQRWPVTLKYAREGDFIEASFEVWPTITFTFILVPEGQWKVFGAIPW